MAIDLNEIQQAFIRANNNIDELMSKFYDTFYNPTPLDITLEWVKDDGTTRSVTVPNRSKIKKQMWDDVNAAVGLWARTFYVDEVNGDDNNAGTSDAPFQTIAKAINSIPVGGKGTIYLANNSKHIVSNIYLANKYVIFTNWDVVGDGSYAVIRKEKFIGFKLVNSFIYVNSSIKLETAYDSDNPVHWNCMFKFVNDCGFSCVALGHWTSDGSDIIQIRMDVPFVNVEDTSALVIFYNCDIDELGEDNTLSRPISVVGLTNTGKADVHTVSCTTTDNVSL